MANPNNDLMRRSQALQRIIPNDLSNVSTASFANVPVLARVQQFQHHIPQEQASSVQRQWRSQPESKVQPRSESERR